MITDLMQIDSSNVNVWFDGMIESKREILESYYKNPKITEKYIHSAKQIMRMNTVLVDFINIKNSDDRKKFAKTLFEALDQVAVHNLTLGTMAQHVDIHTINEAIRDENGTFIRNRRIVYCAMQYQGQLEICYRNPKIKAIKATVIKEREGEKFIWNGVDKSPTHEIE
jgi:hypothetical protein